VKLALELFRIGEFQIHDWSAKDCKGDDLGTCPLQTVQFKAEEALKELGAGLLRHTDAPTVTLPYAGARLGGLAGRHLGFWIFARFDLRRTTTVADVRILDEHDTTTYDVGGHTIGVAVRITTGR
jgi:hypothetical protein